MCCRDELYGGKKPFWKLIYFQISFFLAIMFCICHHTLWKTKIFLRKCKCIYFFPTETCKKLTSYVTISNFYLYDMPNTNQIFVQKNFLVTLFLKVNEPALDCKKKKKKKRNGPRWNWKHKHLHCKLYDKIFVLFGWPLMGSQRKKNDLQLQMTVWLCYKLSSREIN